MPRKPRVFVEGGIYHVYCRASRGEAVFADETEAAAFVDILRKIKQRDGLVFFAWALMSLSHRVEDSRDSIVANHGVDSGADDQGLQPETSSVWTALAGQIQGEHC